MSEIPASNASDDEEQVEREMDDLPEDNDGPGWTIPDGNSTGSTAQEEEESESSKDGSQKVHQSMFTDSDGGSTIKMNEQWYTSSHIPLIFFKTTCVPRVYKFCIVIDIVFIVC